MWWIVAVSILLLLGVYLLLTPPQDDTDFDEPLPMAAVPKTAPAPAASTTAAPKAAPAGPLSIYFGSQTGTAEGFAKALATEAASHGFEPTVVDLEDFEVDQLASSRMAIFAVATYGEGEPTDNAVRFLRALKNSDGELEEDALAGLCFTTFGLGNRQYEHYNKMGRDVHKFLGALGADEAFAYGEGDDDAMLEDDFEAWKEGLWPALLARFHPDGAKAGARKGDAKATTAAPRLLHSVVLMDGEPPANTSSACAPPPANSTSVAASYFSSVAAKVTVNRELRRDLGGGSTRHIELDIAGTGLSYVTADNLAVCPRNPQDVVERVARALDADLEQWFDVKPVTGAGKPAPAPFPTPCTVRTALTQYCDLMGMPRKALLTSLAHFATDPAQKARLLLLGSKEGRADYTTWVVDEGRSLADVLAELPSVKLPLECFLELTPRLQPRYYTISSSSSAFPQSIHATVSVLTEVRPSGRVVKGVCSTYLADLVAGESTCQVFVRQSTFRLPQDSTTPVIMVGPGTGIAPMRAFLQERAFLKEQGAAVGDAVLFFGCRNRDKDFIYEDELLAYTRSGVLTSLETAFSRDQERKVYVQDLLREQGDKMRGLLEGGAHFYVCGGTAMGNDVMAVVNDVLGSDSKTKDLQTAGRYIQELWS